MEEKNKITTIKLSEDTKKRVDKIRSYPKESYDSILRRIMDILNTCRANPEKARGRLASIDRQNRKFKKEFL